jgi:tetratricopeptide (TPR) repeat protein
MRIAVFSALLLVALVTHTPGASTLPLTPPQPSGAALRARGLDYGYNLDYADALASFDEAIALDPDDATAHRLAAATIWMRMLYLQGAITVEEYLGQAQAKVERRPPPIELVAQFDRHIDRALAISERRVMLNPNDADAHYQLGAAAALRTTYIATVNGRVLDSLGTGRRAYSEHKRTLALDPGRKDAALIVGLYRYTIANLSLPMRLMARIAGFEGGRDSGVRLVREAAQFESAAQTNERNYDEALVLVRQLQQQFPRNRLLSLEEGSTALRAAKPAVAIAALNRGLDAFQRDTRMKAFGEEANWRLHRGRALLLLNDAAAARRDLQFAAVADGPRWIQTRARELLARHPR